MSAAICPTPNAGTRVTYLVRYRFFGRAYRNTNGIVISRVTCWVNKQEKEELNTIHILYWLYRYWW